LAHPSVLPLFPRIEHRKGVHAFDWNSAQGPSWYRSHFPSVAMRGLGRLGAGERPIAGEASSSYLFHPAAAGRAATMVGGARIIVLVRDPVDRAYSHYLARVAHGVEPLSFEEAIDREGDRLAGEADRLVADARYRSPAFEQQSYVAQGRYAESLARWLDRY